VIAAAAALMLAIAASRVVLDYHSAAEVAVGLAVGSLGLRGIVVLAGRYRPVRLPILPVAGAALAIALIMASAGRPSRRSGGSGFGSSCCGPGAAETKPALSTRNVTVRWHYPRTLYDDCRRVTGPR